MADNVTLPGTGESVASDDIGGVQHQRFKMVLGADGVNAGDLQPTLTGQVTTGTASVQVVTGAATVFGWSFREDTDSGAAQVEIRDGTTDSDPIIGVVNLATSESVRDWFGPQGIKFDTGIRVVKPAGTSLGTIWYV